MKASLLIIDAHNLIRRIYGAIPGDDNEAKNKQTWKTTEHTLNKLRQQLSPSHCIWVFDDQSTTWRHQLFPDYKKGRKPMSDVLKKGLSDIRQALETKGVFCFSQTQQEADDIIATIAIKSSPVADVTILSSDKAFLQLIPNGIKIYHYFEQRWANEDWVQKKFGISSHQLTHYWGLVGDSTNGFSGVPSIGPKTAQTLLEQFSSLETLIQTAHHSNDDNIAPKLKKQLTKLRSHDKDAILSKTLATLKIDIQLGINLKSLRLPIGE